MKATRALLWSAAIVGAVLAVAITVALNASFQTWAARRVLAGQRGIHATVEKVDANFSRAELLRMTVESHGAVLTLPAVETEMPLLTAAALGHVHIKRLVAHGWTLDLTKAQHLGADFSALPESSPVARATGFSLLSSASAAETVVRPAANRLFRGLFSAARLPVELSVDALDLDGEVILPAVAGQASVRAHVTLRGGGLAAGRKGVFSLDVMGAKSDGGSVALHGDLTALMDTPQTFTEFGATANASASGPQFPEGVTLKIDASAHRSTAGESYAILLAGARRQLAALNAEFLTATERISGHWQVDLHDSDVAPFTFGKTLPTFAARGEGALETSAAFQEVHANGHLQASAQHLEALRPQLSAIGPITLDADFDLLQHGDFLRIERLHVTAAAATPVATLRALQPFEFNPATAELRVADPAKELVGISLTGVPPAWVQPFLGGLQISGGDLRGEMAVSARGGGLALRATAPLTMNDLALAKEGRRLLEGLDVALDPSGDYTPQGWQVQISDLKVTSHGAGLMQLDAKAGQLAGKDHSIKATGHWLAGLPGWISQPGLAGQLQLDGGAVRGEFTATMDGTASLEAKIAISDLVAATKEKLPDVTFQVRADMAADGKTTFEAPLVLSQGARKSDLLLAGTFTPAGTATAIDARLSSDVIFVEDVKLLALLVPAAGAETPAQPANAHAGPFWETLTGQVALALKRIVYGGSFEVTDIGGTIRLDPSALSLESVRAASGPQSDLKLQGGLTFDSREARAYALGLDATVSNFDTGPVFRAIDPAKLPTLDARVNLTTHLVGAGASAAEAAERARGEIQVTGHSGVFRALSADMSDKVQKTQSTVAAIGGLIGAVTGKKEYVDAAGRTQILSDIAKALAEIPFDQLNVTATRDTALNLSLKDFTLISPEVRLTGGGGIQYVEGTSILSQPLDLKLQLSARGHLGDLLKRAGLLEAKQDNLGYTALAAPIEIGGTLANTDTSALLKTLLNLAFAR